jgi:hypothetical protein
LEAGDFAGDLAGFFLAAILLPPHLFEFSLFSSFPLLLNAWIDDKRMHRTGDQGCTLVHFRADGTSRRPAGTSLAALARDRDVVCSCLCVWKA